MLNPESFLLFNLEEVEKSQANIKRKEAIERLYQVVGAENFNIEDKKNILVLKSTSEDKKITYALNALQEKNYIRFAQVTDNTFVISAWRFDYFIMPNEEMTFGAIVDRQIHLHIVHCLRVILGGNFECKSKEQAFITPLIDMASEIEERLMLLKKEQAINYGILYAQVMIQRVNPAILSAFYINNYDLLMSKNSRKENFVLTSAPKPNSDTTQFLLKAMPPNSKSLSTEPMQIIDASPLVLARILFNDTTLSFQEKRVWPYSTEVKSNVPVENLKIHYDSFIKTLAEAFKALKILVEFDASQIEIDKKNLKSYMSISKWKNYFTSSNKLGKDCDWFVVAKFFVQSSAFFPAHADELYKAAMLVAVSSTHSLNSIETVFILMAFEILKMSGISELNEYNIKNKIRSELKAIVISEDKISHNNLIELVNKFWCKKSYFYQAFYTAKEAHLLIQESCLFFCCPTDQAENILQMSSVDNSSIMRIGSHPETLAITFLLQIGGKNPTLQHRLLKLDELKNFSWNFLKNYENNMPANRKGLDIIYSDFDNKMKKIDELEKGNYLQATLNK